MSAVIGEHISSDKDIYDTSPQSVKSEGDNLLCEEKGDEIEKQKSAENVKKVSGETVEVRHCCGQQTGRKWSCVIGCAIAHFVIGIYFFYIFV